MAKYLIENHGDVEHTLRPSGAEETTLPPGRNFTGHFNKDEAARMQHGRGLRVTEVKPEPKPEATAEGPKAARPAKRKSRAATPAPEPVSEPAAEPAPEA